MGWNNTIWTVSILWAWVSGLVILGAIDTWLIFTRRVTISQYVWADPLSGIPIVLWAGIGPVFLAGHFWLGWFR